MKKQKDIFLVLGLGSTAKGSGSAGMLGLLTLQGLKKRGDIGRKISKKDLEGPQVSIWFANAEAVTSLCAELMTVANDMAKAEKEIKDASINISAGCTDKLGKSPREGKRSGVYDASKNKRGGRGGKSVKAARGVGRNTSEGR
jgi:hypothetical protein